jgi:hypothetical protein
MFANNADSLGRETMFKKIGLFAPAALVCVGLLGLTAAKADDDAHCYTLDSLDLGKDFSNVLALRAPAGQHFMHDLPLKAVIQAIFRPRGNGPEL